MGRLISSHAVTGVRFGRPSKHHAKYLFSEELNDVRNASRKDFLKASVGVGGALGILASPIGMTQAIDAVSADVSRVTQTYTRLRIAGVSDLADGQPIDFQYPLQEHNNLLVNLGTSALLGRRAGH
jgi:hypothetical protein